MHSFESGDGTVFIFNPDLSGEVEIVQGDGDRRWMKGRALAEFLIEVAAGLDPADQNAIAFALGFPEAEPTSPPSPGRNSCSPATLPP